MLDHIGIRVADYQRSKSFYEQALRPLGYALRLEFDSEAAGFGVDGHPDFWIGRGGSGPGMAHVAFVSPDRATVTAFYQAALAAGGTDNGGPGLRPQYHPDYYAAFVLDPDGNNIEAVCHRPE
ncbi:MAG: VOC family protein [Pseudomonadota bacterium]